MGSDAANIGEAAIAICTEQGFGSILAQATPYRGQALAQQGQTEEGIGLIRRGLEAQLATGAGLFQTHQLYRLATLRCKIRGDSAAISVGGARWCWRFVRRVRRGWRV
jgi:hypothetical protein